MWAKYVAFKFSVLNRDERALQISAHKWRESRLSKFVYKIIRSYGLTS